MKILQINHPYHKTTQSSQVLTKLIEKLGNVRVEYINPVDIDSQISELLDWKPDVVFVSMHEYLALPFVHQGIPTWVVPMFDGIGGYTSDFWRELRGVNVLSFSSTVHAYFRTLGFPSFQLKYFPSISNDFYSEKKEEVKLWWRVSEINPDIVYEKCKASGMILDVRMGATDYSFDNSISSQSPNIRRSTINMDGNSESYLNWLKSGMYFVAPRRFEGIGLSILEAMSYGLIPISNNAPVLNEYIRHSKTGILTSFGNLKSVQFPSNPSKILSNIESEFVEGEKSYLRRSNQFLSIFENQKKKQSKKILNIDESLNHLHRWRLRNGQGEHKYSVSKIADIRSQVLALRYRL